MKEICLAPDFYSQFQCKGGDCRYTCCQDWKIPVSKNEYHKLRNIRIQDDKKMQDTIRNLFHRTKGGSDLQYADLVLDNQRICPLLSEEGLCSLQSQCGFNFLPDICKSFPRQLTVKPAKEAGLSTACEKVVELLLNRTESLKFQMTEAEKLIYALIVVPENPLCEYYSDIRTLCIWILQNQEYPFGDRMILLGLALKDLAELEAAKAVDQVPLWFVKWQQLPQDQSQKEALAKIQPNYSMLVPNSAQITFMVQSTHSSYKNMMDQVFSNLGIEMQISEEGKIIIHSNIDTYREALAHFEETFPQHELIWENIMVHLFFTYGYPFSETGVIWDSYRNFCSLYSLLKFTCIGYMADKDSLQDLEYGITEFSRNTIHNTVLKRKIFDLLKWFSSDSLAHLSILVKG